LATATTQEQSRKKQLGEIDRRVRYLSKRLDEVEIIDRIPDNQDRVYFGATVTVEKEDGGETRYRIVGADETDAATSSISVDSPVARALLGRGLDEEVRVELPTGSQILLITGISYPP
jgi:transcription elongation factor GreB